MQKHKNKKNYSIKQKTERQNPKHEHKQLQKET